jgi:hypothetical protein
VEDKINRLNKVRRNKSNIRIKYYNKSNIPKPISYNSYIESSEFDISKLNGIYPIINDNGTFCKYRTKYRYSNERTDWFMFKTPFIKLTKNPNNYSDNSIRLSMNEQVYHELVPLLKQYDKFIRDNILDLGLHDYKCIKELVTEKELLDGPPENDIDLYKDINLKLIVDKKTNNIKSDVINYCNPKSKHEIMKNIKIQDLFDFLKYGREVRFILYPITWKYNQQKGKYGSQLVIWKMEVKYERSNITSILEKDEIIEYPDILDVII